MNNVLLKETKIMRIAKLGLLAAIITILFATVLPASAAPGASITSLTPNTSNCTLTVVFKVEDAGAYYVQIWDDGSNKAAGGTNASAGATVTVVFHIGEIGTSAPGIGVYIADNPTIISPPFDDNDPYVFDAGDCGGEGEEWSVVSVSSAVQTAGCTNPLPDGFVVRSVPDGAPAYFAPRLDTYTNFDLPAGTWYVGATSGDFSHVWIACQADLVWIPTANVAG